MLSRVAGLASITVLALIVVGVWQLIDRPVERLRVVGDLTTAEQDIVIGRLADERLGGILSVDIDHLRSLLAEIEWARDISVRRRWPDHLEISLRREQPVARWGDDRYVTARGNLLELPTKLGALPRFDVAHSSATEAMEIYRLVDQLVRGEQLVIAELKQDAQAEWSVSFSKGFEVFLGAGQIDQKVNRFIQIHRKAREQSEKIAYVDLRYSKGAAVKFQELVASRGITGPAPQ